MKRFFFILLSFIILYFGQAQRSEIGTMLGTSFYLGDLNSIPFRNAKFAGGLVYRYNFSPRMALKANILFGKITASDKTNHSILKDKNNPTLLENGKIGYPYLWDYKDRNLSFSSPLTEVSAQLEINFFNIYTVSYKNQISPYLFGGAALFSFNPQADYTDPKTREITTFDLQPMGTEGQGREDGPKKYPLIGFAIPFGIGFKANIGKYICIGAEWGMRFTFTKYLDDVGGEYYDFNNLKVSDIVKYFADPRYSPGNYPTNYPHKDAQRYSTIKTDWYSFAGVVITIRIGNEDRFCDIKTNVKFKHKQGKKR